MTSTALVLGAGGLTGAAFHAGVLAGLADQGWDALTADLVVGTSAGASTAATLRAGVPVADHLAAQRGEPLSPETEERRRGLPPALDFSAGPPPPPEGRRPLDPGLAARAFLRRGWPRPGLLVAGLLPRGEMDTGIIARRLDALYAPLPWPEAPTWICAVRVGDGARRVFGRDPSAATIGEAVAASSAVPSRLAPVIVDGALHVDGAVHSPTNADVVAGLGFDRVVVLAPMAGDGGWRDPGRAYFQRLLDQEADAVVHRGTEVVTVVPDAETLAAMAGDTLQVGKEAAVATAARRLGRQVPLRG